MSSTALALVFGGCCSNALTTERLTAAQPSLGILITFLQFLIVAVYALPAQLVLTPRLALRTRRVPLPAYLVQVALFYVINVLNNAAFAYDIPMSVHIVFRSGGMIINMLLGALLFRRRYAPRQVLSVLAVTIGIILTTFSASKPVPSARSSDVSLYAIGVLALALSLLLSCFLGFAQDHVFARYIKPFEALSAADPLAQPSWQENMFYIHSLALPLFYFSRHHIASEFLQLRNSPAVPLASLPFLPASLASLALPSMYLYLFANTLSQLFCVIGVNRITGRVPSLTVTLILTVRKAVSFLLSVAVYGGQANAMMWTGAFLVFAGTIVYSTASSTKPKDTKDKHD